MKHSARCSTKGPFRGVPFRTGEFATHRALSFSPGIVDTRMQEEIRLTPRKDFSQLDRFIAFKEEGRLASPEAVAEVLIRYLESDTFENGALVDYRELTKIG